MTPDTRPPTHSTPYRARWQGDAFAAALLAVCALWTFRALLFQNKALYWGDIGLYFLPMTAFLHDSLQAGRVPLWNPLLLCGTPFVGNPQTWPLYPVTGLLAWLPPDRFISVTIAFHVWLAAWGTFLFLRHAEKTTFAGALLGAVTFGFGGQLVSKSQFPNMLQAIAYLPWLLWTTERLTRQWRGRAAAALGTLLGLQLLAAHAQMTLLSLYLTTAYGLCRLWRQHRQGNKLPARAVPLLLGAGALAAGLAMGQLLPTIELTRDAWRQHLSFAVVNRFYLPFNQLANPLLPTLHGHPLRGDFTGRGNFWETCCYLGPVPVALAVCGAARARAARFWLAVWVAGTWLALGGAGGLYWIAYKLLPGFASFHDPARCLLWSALAASVLAAHGWDRLFAAFGPKRPLPAIGRTPPRPQKGDPPPAGEGKKTASPNPPPTGGGWRASASREGFLEAGPLLAILLIALAFAPLTRFDSALYPLAPRLSLSPVTPVITAIRSDPAFQSHQARFLAPDSARTWERFTGHQSYRQDAPNYQPLWADTLTPNLLMPYDVMDAYGYEPLARRDTQALAGNAAHAFDPDAPPAARAAAARCAGLLAVRDIALLRVRPPAFPGLTPLAFAATLPPLHARVKTPAQVFLVRNDAYLPRARLSDGAGEPLPVSHGSPTLSLRERVERGALSLPSPARGRGSSGPGVGLFGPVIITNDTPDEVDITVNALRPARLLLADTRAPGWTAAIDGQPAPIDTYNTCLRAVSLPAAGTHRVQFVYKPTAFRVGLYLTLLSWSTLAGLCAATVAKNPRRRAGIPAPEGE